MTLRIGVSAYDISAFDLVQLAVAADELGFDSLWLGEHVVLPCDYTSEHPTAGDSAHQHHTGPIIDPSTTLIDPLVALSACAAATTRLRLATGIFILPLRHPLITARMTATLQDVAAGRFLLGVGSGWLREEFESLDVPFDERGGRMDEAIAILREAWSAKPFSHTNAHYSFGTVQMAPEPVDVPLILGGNTERALRRAAAAGDGWFGSGTPSFADAVRLRDRVMSLRDASAPGTPFPIFVRVARPDVTELARYDDEGFEHVLVWADQVWPRDGDLDQKRRAIADAADRLGVTRGTVA
jgi:probable F420-dependent oxidoreductase